MLAKAEARAAAVFAAARKISETEREVRQLFLGMFACNQPDEHAVCVCFIMYFLLLHDSQRPVHRVDAPSVTVASLGVNCGSELYAAITSCNSSSSCTKHIQVMERGTKAFVSYIRGYKEHHCKFVFQLADLSLEQMGYMFGLLRLPVMKEV